MIRVLFCVLLIPTLAFAKDGQVGTSSSGEAQITLVIEQRIGFTEVTDEKTGKTQTIDTSTIEYESFYVEVETVSSKKNKTRQKQKVLVFVPKH